MKRDLTDSVNMIPQVLYSYRMEGDKIDHTCYRLNVTFRVYGLKDTGLKNKTLQQHVINILGSHYIGFAPKVLTQSLLGTEGFLVFFPFLLRIKHHEKL